MIDAAALHAQTFPGGTVVEMVVPWQTPPKARHRTVEGRTYAPDKADEEATATILRTQWPLNRVLLSTFALTVIAYRKTFQRVDIDNLAKHLLDACNGVLWKDDHQCVALLALKDIDRDNPRTVVCVSSYPQETP